MAPGPHVAWLSPPSPPAEGTVPHSHPTPGWTLQSACGMPIWCTAQGLPCSQVHCAWAGGNQTSVATALADVGEAPLLGLQATADGEAPQLSWATVADDVLHCVHLACDQDSFTQGPMVEQSPMGAPSFPSPQVSA